jgi:hypothetical protein
MFAQKMPISSVQDVKIFNNALKNVKQMICIIIRNNVMKAMLNFSMNLKKVKKFSFIQMKYLNLANLNQLLSMSPPPKAAR